MLNGIETRLEAIAAPLPPGAPDPADFRYEADFDALDTLIRTSERDGPMAISWSEVVRQAQIILETRSKDLNVACWLGIGLVRTEGLPGLAMALRIVHAMIAEFWDTLFPVRPRARIAAVDWLIERSATFVPQDLPGDPAPVLAAHDALVELDEVLADRMGLDAVALGPLLQPLRRLRQEAERAAALAVPPPVAQPAPAPAELPAAPAQPVAPVQTPAPAATAVIPDLPPLAVHQDRERSLSRLRDGLRESALALLQADAAEPRAYLLLGTATWLGINELPPVSDGRTSLNAPPATRRDEFDALRAAGDRLGLVVALQTFCSGSGFFWLDGQRLTAQALGELGPRHAICGRLVSRNVLTLLDRLPGLADLRFADGTPMADPATLSWLESSKPAGSGGGGAVSDWDAGYEEARRLAADGDPGGAQALIGKGLMSAGNGRARAGWQLAQARFWLDGDRPLLAANLLVHLEQTIETQALEAWDPDLAAAVSLLLCRCLERPDMQDAQRDDFAPSYRRAFSRLVRTDPTEASKFTPSFGSTDPIRRT